MKTNINSPDHTFINKVNSDNSNHKNQKNDNQITNIHRRMKSVIDLCKSADNNSSSKYRIIAEAQFQIIREFFEAHQKYDSSATIHECSDEQNESINNQPIICSYCQKDADKFLLGTGMNIKQVIKQLCELRQERITILDSFNQEIREHNKAKAKIIQLEENLRQLVNQNLANPEKGRQNNFLTKKQKAPLQYYHNINSQNNKNLKPIKENVLMTLKKKGKSSHDMTVNKKLSKNYSTYNLGRIYQNQSYHPRILQNLSQYTNMHYQRPQQQKNQREENNSNIKSCIVKNQKDTLFYKRPGTQKRQQLSRQTSKVKFDINPILLASSSSSFSSSSGRPKTSLKSILDERNRQQILIKEAELLFAD